MSACHDVGECVCLSVKRDHTTNAQGLVFDVKDLAEIRMGSPPTRVPKAVGRLKSGTDR